MTVSIATEFTPLRDGYTFNPGYPTVQLKYAGLTKKRQENLVLNAVHRVTVNWVLTSPQKYTRFMGFFRTTLQNGTLGFLMDLVSDIGVPTTHRCRTMGRLPKLTQMRGNNFYCSCELEVEANPTFTGVIEYQATTNSVQLVRVFPFFSSHFRDGENVRIIGASGIHPDGDVVINLDGVYEIQGTPTINSIEFDDPEDTSADWTVLAGLTPATFGSAATGEIVTTLTKIPL